MDCSASRGACRSRPFRQNFGRSWSRGAVVKVEVLPLRVLGEKGAMGGDLEDQHAEIMVLAGAAEKEGADIANGRLVRFPLPRPHRGLAGG